MKRKEILDIYKESMYERSEIKTGFDLVEKIPYGTALIFIPQAFDGTIVRILRAYGVEQDLYVTETRKKYRAMLHRMPRVKVVDNREVEDIDLVRVCGQYKKFPKCTGCPNEEKDCIRRGVKFDVAVSLDGGLDKNMLMKHSGNVILVEDKNMEEQ